MVKVSPVRPTPKLRRHRHHSTGALPAGPGRSQCHSIRLASLALLFFLAPSIGCDYSSETTFLAAIDDVRSGKSTQIDMRDKPLPNDSLLALLRDVPEVKALNLDGSPVSDSSLKSMGELPNLRELSLTRTLVTDAGMNTIVDHFKNLQFLRLDETRVSDRGIETISQLPRLEILSLYRTSCSDRACQALVAVPNLRYVSLDQTRVTERSIECLVKAPKMQRISVWQCNLDERELQSYRDRFPTIQFNR